jgi:hypothetical protein
LEQPSLNANASDSAHRHLRGAMYLAGYAAECILKAYMIQYVGAQTLNAAVETINRRRQSKGLESVENIARSAAGHKIMYLLQLTDLPLRPGYDQALWGRVGGWTSSWRYETERVQRDVAIEFVRNIEIAHSWVSSKLTGA